MEVTGGVCRSVRSTDLPVVESVPLHPGRRPPIFSTPLPPTSSSSPSRTPFSAPPSRLHTFTALPPSAISVLAPRRHPAAVSHLGNGPRHISIVTSTGFQKLTVDTYQAAVKTLRPDIAIPLADLTYGSDGGLGGVGSAAGSTAGVASVPYPAAKRAVRMAERSEDWLDHLYRDGVAETTGATLFAPTLPVPYATQWQYLNRVAELAAREGGPDGGCDGSAKPPIAGLAVYDVDLLPDIHADYADSLAPLPRLSLHPALTPHHVLRQVALGVDVLLLPAITDASEQGLAYTFAWPGGAGEDALPEAGHPRLPLAVDLTDPAHKAALTPLSPHCGGVEQSVDQPDDADVDAADSHGRACPSCAAHHRAYVHHLLDAHEMLAWTLLQLHNHHVVAAFFAGIRRTLAAEGPAGFRRRALRFQAVYEPDLPVGRATRPRARGYQVRVDGVVAARLNKPAWGRLQDVAAADVGETAVGDDEASA